MKVLFLISKRFDEDLDISTRIETVRNLKKLRVDVYLVLPYHSAKIPTYGQYGIEENLIFIKTFKQRVLFSVIYVFNLFFFLFKTLLDIDFVIVDDITFFSIMPFAILRKFGLFKRNKFVYDIRSIPVETHDLISKLKEKFFFMSLKMAAFFLDGILVISDSMRRLVTRMVGLPEEKIGIYTSGVNIDFFDPTKVKTLKRDDHDKFVIMYHGTLSKNRGILETIYALQKVKNTLRNVELIILGEGVLRSTIQKLIMKLDLRDYVKIYNAVPFNEVARAISQCDVGIVPLPNILWWTISSPLKLLEYLAMEKPVILTDIPAHREIVGNHKCCFFIKNHSPDEIAKGIFKAYKSKKYLRQMGREGRELVLNEYTWEKQAFRIVSFLKKIYSE